MTKEQLLQEFDALYVRILPQKPEDEEKTKLLQKYYDAIYQTEKQELMDFVAHTYDTAHEEGRKAAVDYVKTVGAPGCSTSPFGPDIDFYKIAATSLENAGLREMKNPNK